MYLKTSICASTRRLSGVVRALFCAIAVHGASSTAFAGTVQVGFTAVITSVSDPALYLPDDIWVGDMLSGYYTYELDAIDTDPNPHRGLYQFTAPPNTLVVYADAGWVFRTNPSNVLVQFTIADSIAAQIPYDGYKYRSVNNTGSNQSGGQLLVSFVQLELVDNSLTALSSDALPLSAPDLSDWPNKRQLVIAGSGGDWTIWADVQSITSTLPTGTDDVPGTATASLDVNIPNPFNPSTIIPFKLDQSSFATLTVHDVTGRLVRTLIEERLPKGNHEIRWDGRDNRGAEVASGAYIYRLLVNGESYARKATLLK